MGFWNDAANSEPKRNFRFLIQLQGMGGDDVMWYAKTVDIPNFSITNIQHNFLDNEYNFPGRMQWQEINLSLVDPISVDAVQKTNALVVNAGYQVPGSAPGVGSPGASTMSRNRMNNSLQGVIINVLDAQGDAIETWTLKNPIITSVKFGTMDYSSDDLKQIDIGLKYDWATCETDQGGIQFKEV
jgi:hypothetical protein